MQYQHNSGQLLVRMDPGDEIFTSLYQACAAENITFAAISGIGAVKDITMGYFDVDKNSYAQREHAPVSELLSLQGNIAMLDEAPFLHLHGIMSGHDYQCFGGHLFSAIVAVTCEVFVTSQALPVTREPIVAIEIWLYGIFHAVAHHSHS